MGGFRRLRRDLARQATPVVRSDTAFHIHVTDLVPENLAYDARRRVFFVGSQGKRMIYRVDGTGAARPFAGPGPGVTSR